MFPQPLVQPVESERVRLKEAHEELVSLLVIAVDELTIQSQEGVGRKEGCALVAVQKGMIHPQRFPSAPQLPPGGRCSTRVAASEERTPEHPDPSNLVGRRTRARQFRAQRRLPRTSGIRASGLPEQFTQAPVSLKACIEVIHDRGAHSLVVLAFYVGTHRIFENCLKMSSFSSSDLAHPLEQLRVCLTGKLFRVERPYRALLAYLSAVLEG